MSNLRISGGKIAWASAIIIIALIAIGVQIDRQARRDEIFAHFVPPIFRGYALEPLAREAYGAGNYADGIAYSRDLVFRRPLPAENLALLTNGLIKSGRGDAALPVLLLAAQRGWRDRYTQRVMAAAAQQSGASSVAAQRLLALWRQGDRDQKTKELSKVILTTPDGVKVFSEGIIEPDRSWANDFIVWAVENLPYQSMLAISRSMANDKITIDCGVLSLKIRQLALASEANVSNSLWSAFCSKGFATDPADFRFKSFIRVPGPFDWRLLEEAGLDVKFVETKAGTHLHYENSRPIKSLAATRIAKLGSGQHIAHVRGDVSIAKMSFVLQIDCLGKNTALRRLYKMRINKGINSFVIPDKYCDSQEISILVPYGVGDIAPIAIR
ncbi:hypothetical protein [Novosphingobium sp. P6W]|uniref:hypothetical protein n=1 Tax=Novosphingobium sp. P6W TaxID=1609758 RepID=UPI000AACDA90|nr:hypothetical protein [Novosphingobium sp. P6W]